MAKQIKDMTIDELLEYKNSFNLYCVAVMGWHKDNTNNPYDNLDFMLQVVEQILKNLSTEKYGAEIQILSGTPIKQIFRDFIWYVRSMH